MSIRFLQNRVNNYIASTILFGIYRITRVYAKQVDKTCDYIVVYTGWMTPPPPYLTKEEMLAWACWKEIGHPQRLYWKHICDEIKLN